MMNNNVGLLLINESQISLKTSLISSLILYTRINVYGYRKRVVLITIVSKITHESYKFFIRAKDAN